ncbi:hypothetical protein [Blautia stercoris]
MKKVLNYIFFLIVFGSLCFQNGCGASNKIQGNQQTNQEEVTLTCSYLNQSKTKLLKLLELSEEDLEVQIPLLYKVDKTFSFDENEYYPWLEFSDDTDDAELTQYGFEFSKLSEEETLSIAQELVRTISAELGLRNVPATNTFMDVNQVTESNSKGISEITYEELKKWDTYQLTEVWNKDDSMYFKVDMSKLSLQNESSTILIRIAYLPKGYPAFLGES